MLQWTQSKRGIHDDFCHEYEKGLALNLDLLLHYFVKYRHPDSKKLFVVLDCCFAGKMVVDLLKRKVPKEIEL